MTKWLYRTVHIPYSKKHKTWALTYADRESLVGLQAILDAYGEAGWELVHLVPEHYRAYPGFGQWHLEPEAYRATFRRAGENES